MVEYCPLTIYIMSVYIYINSSPAILLKLAYK